MEPIILASQSPRRKLLLEWAKVEFDVISKKTDESFPPGMIFEEIPIHIARNKANAVRNSELYLRYENKNMILAADTIVLFGNEIIGKPHDRNEAIEILCRLSGNMHRVITGVVLQKEHKEICFSETTEVWFHELSMDQIVYYVTECSPYDKAGAYAIQEWIGVIGIKAINGDFYNVMGLPVSRVVKALQNFS